jgi:hypothetical protein
VQICESKYGYLDCLAFGAMDFSICFTRCVLSLDFGYMKCVVLHACARHFPKQNIYNETTPASCTDLILLLN